MLKVVSLSGVGEEVTRLALYLFGKELKMVGGMASDDFRMEKTFTFIFVDDDVCVPMRLVLCLIASKMPLFYRREAWAYPSQSSFESYQSVG